MDQRLGRVAAEIHPGRVVDGRDAASPMLGHVIPPVPKTDEKRIAPCAVAGPGGGR